MGFVFPPLRFCLAWLSFGICVTTGITCSLFLFGVEQAPNTSSAALHSLDYNRKLSVNRSRTPEFDALSKCTNFSVVFSRLSEIGATDSALQASFYTVGINWASSLFQKKIAFPLFVTSLVVGILALVTSLINCYWPVSDEMEQPQSRFTVRKIRMRVPQKNQKWSGYIYTHLLNDGKKAHNGDSAEQGCDDLPAANKSDGDTMFDRQALRFIRKTISACGMRSNVDPQEDS